MSVFQVYQCPVCQGTDFSSYILCKDHFVTGESFPVKKCISCGFKITENTPDEKHMGRYYESESYISHSNTSKGLVNRVYQWVRKIMLARKWKLAERETGKREGTVLDIGSGTGFFLKEMKEHGWKVSGTEKSEKAREYAKKNLGIFLRDTDDLFLPGEERYDVITLWHVLEHVHDLEKNFNAFFRLLENNGKLIIALPNHNSLDARKYSEFWAAWDVPRHIWHFTADHIVRLAQNHGFSIKRTYPMHFDAFYVSLLSENYKKSAFPTIKGMITGLRSWVNSLFRPNQCSSLIYVFEKSEK